MGLLAYVRAALNPTELSGNGPGILAVGQDGALWVRPVGGSAPVASSSHLASGVLPASGAYTSQTAFAVPAGAKTVSFLVNYTGGAAGGSVAYKIVKGYSSGSLAAEQVAQNSLAVSGTTASQSIYDAIYQRPVTGTSASSFPVDVDVSGGWTYVALYLAETGVTATPGTAAISVAASY